MEDDYKYIKLPNGDYIQIKFDIDGVVYDRFNSKDEHQESYGFTLYEEIQNIKELSNRAK